MRINNLLSLAALAIIISFQVYSFAGTYSGGTGDANDPFQIFTPNDMQEIGANTGDWDKEFLLTKDIDLSEYTGTSFNIIGNDTKQFTGVFDGNDHRISNFTYTSTNQRYVALFGNVGSVGEIRDLGVLDVNIDVGEGDYIGSLVGINEGGNITNCYATGSLSGNGSNLCIGGLVGDNFGNITSCSAVCNVDADTYNGGIGGLVGTNGRDIIDCHTGGNVSGSGHLGGLAGSNFGDITDCSATASVIRDGDGYGLEGYNAVGGLVGMNDGPITNCYTTGTVIGSVGVMTLADLVGGIVGRDWGSSIINCYATGDVSGVGFKGGLIGTMPPCSRPITNCYAAGTVSGGGFNGGLMGANGGSPTGCFWDSDVNPTLTGVGQGTDPAGIMGRTTSQMQTESTFTDYGWDFVGEVVNGIDDIWRMCVDGISYPKLNWEQPAGDFDCPDGVSIEDLTYLTNYWLDDALNPYEGADLNGDGEVTFEDYAVFAQNFLQGI